MLKVLSRFKRLIGTGLTLFGVFWLPKDVQDSPDAFRPWAGALAMVEQNTALWAFSILAFGLIAWSDGRAFIKERRAVRAAASLEVWRSSRTRFTIREAACLVRGVHPKDFDASPAAQSEANEMLFYTKQALIMPAEMSEHQHTMLRQGRSDHGFDLDGVSLDTFISAGELDRYIRPGWKTWLPILDEKNRNR